ncbi:MAG: energy-coupling factor ABC transporter ATP-binding protein [Saccharospirillum sp.]|nr:energy-coupling factor ABC transporter ATP-binding protein [Saccharospirillum sp.]
MQSREDDRSEHSVLLDQVSLARDGVEVLHTVSLTLTEPRIGLIGDNGSGKSSLIRLLNGLLQPSQGDVYVNGIKPTDGPEVMASEVGFIFQNPDHQLIFPTVLEELSFGLRNQGATKKAAEQGALALLAEHDREHWAERAVHSLSEGQKQLVCILAVLIMKPRLMVLDEPFSALDLPTRLHLMDWLHSLPQQVLMISHDLDTLADFDRVVWLDQGRVRGDGVPRDILAAYREASQARVAL